MDSGITARKFENLLKNIQPGPDRPNRALAIFAAAIATGEERAIAEAASELRSMAIARTDLYEVILQSYLFLGFPRMLIAAECLASAWPVPSTEIPATAETDFTHWKSRGADLYKQVYGRNADRLRERVMSFAPEIFDWMITEGYGKVLSRPELGIVTRELAVIAFLTVDNRPKQLLSHLKGALLVGATREQLQVSIDDLATIAPEGFAMARELLNRLGDTP